MQSPSRNDVFFWAAPLSTLGYFPSFLASLPGSRLSTFLALSHLGCDISGSTMVNIAAQRLERPAKKLPQNTWWGRRRAAKTPPENGALAEHSPCERNCRKAGEKVAG